MNSIKVAIAILGLLASALTCQSLSPRQTPVSNPLESDVPIFENEFNATEEIITEEAVIEEGGGLLEENFSDPGNPEDYTDICEYGDALIPHLPFKYYDHDYVEDGSNPMKIDSWVHATMENSCIPVGRTFGEKPWYMRDFLTTWDKNDVLNFYINHFKAAGYSEIEDPYRGITFSGSGGHTIEITIINHEDFFPNDPSSKGVHNISFTLRCCSE